MKKTSLAFLSIIFLSISPVAQDIEDDLLLFYPFNGNTEDSSPNGYDGEPFGINYTEDRFGNPNGAASFDGSNDYVNFPNLEELKPDLPISFSLWIKYDGESNQDRAVFNTSFEENINTGVFLTSRSSLGTYAVGYGDGAPVYNSSSIRSYASNTEINIDEWIHLAIVVSGAQDFQIYVNCIENGGEYNGSGGELVYSDLPGCIGRHDQNTGTVEAYYFDGAIDDFRYWNRALTEQDVKELCSGKSLSFDNDIYNESFLVYPNPAKHVINLDLPSNAPFKAAVFNAIGQKIIEVQNQRMIKLSPNLGGVYFIEVEQNQTIYRQRFIVSK